MENNRWAYPCDTRGQRVPFDEMRQHIWELDADEFPSLSAAVRMRAAMTRRRFRWKKFLATSSGACFRHPIAMLLSTSW
ncbi:ParB-like protein [Paraburkholderia fungorum]|uniref:ParB-like protein n=1 Tax=Paraburkholderia fungorum TaxID=134537 RepID=UPI0030B951D5